MLLTANSKAIGPGSYFTGSANTQKLSRSEISPKVASWNDLGAYGLLLKNVVPNNEENLKRKIGPGSYIG